MTIGLIGYGRFGRLAAKSLASHSRVLVFDKRGVRGRTGSRRITPAPLEEVAASDIVVLAVPVSAIRGVLREIRPFVKAEALVVDVCAVKVEPVRWMKETLPRGVSILGTHPFFGPDSAAGGLKGHRIVLCPVRIPSRRMARIKHMLRREGLDVQVMSPELHDRMVAETIFLTQHIGRLVHLAALSRWPRSTENYKRLYSIVEAARHDTVELFTDMWRFNPRARKVASALEKAHRRLQKERMQVRRLR